MTDAHHLLADLVIRVQVVGLSPDDIERAVLDGHFQSRIRSGIDAALDRTFPLRAWSTTPRLSLDKQDEDALLLRVAQLPFGGDPELAERMDNARRIAADTFLTATTPQETTNDD